MNKISEEEQSLIYVKKSPDVESLKTAYEDTLQNLDTYFDDCIRSYDDRRNQWNGKSDDLRKHGANSFPWDGASDMEVNVIGERIDSMVAMLDQALSKSHIKAFPTSMTSMPKAAMVSSFLKWMRSTYIPDFKNQMELGANYLLEKGIMISHVGWKKEQRTYKQTVTIEQIAELSMDLANRILGGNDDDDVADSIMQAFPSLPVKRAKQAVLDLRKTGIAEVSISRASVDCPVVCACAPDGEVIYPSYVTDPQRSPYVFYRAFLTPQEIEKMATNNEWDRDWVDYAITNLKGTDSMTFDGDKQRFSRKMMMANDDLIMVVYAYQRLIDEEDGSEGIYCTIFNPSCEGYAKHELLNGHDDYPFVVTRLSSNEKRMYETSSFCDILRGSQIQIKTERDSRIDRASMATLPPLMHPTGRPPSQWAPGVRLPYRRLGEIQWGPIPPMDNGSVEIESAMEAQANRAVGLDLENPISSIRQQFVINKFLDHVREVLSMAWKLFQRMGPDEIFFQVTGNPNPQVMTKGDPDDNYSITVAFDSQSSDPETAETQLKNLMSLIQFDRNARIDVDKLLEFAVASINPIAADFFLMPVDDAQDKITKNVTDDLSKIFAGIEVPAQASGAQMALQIVQSYVQQPDIMARAQQDEAFAERLKKYAEQYQFQLQQSQNAQIGRIGTAPAQMGGVQTQGMQQ